MLVNRMFKTKAEAYDRADELMICMGSWGRSFWALSGFFALRKNVEESG